MYYISNIYGGNVMNNDLNKDQQKEAVITNRSIRTSDDTFDRFKKLYNGVEGVNQDIALKELLDLRERVVLENDVEFGSQIKQVNELTNRIGEIFASVIKQAGTKSELDIAKYEKLKKESSDEILSLKVKLKNSTEELDQEKIESANNWHGKFKLESELDELKADKQKQSTEYEDRITELKADKQKQSAEYEDRITELKNLIQEKDEKIATKNEKIDELEKEIENMQREISVNRELKTSLLHLQEENETLKRQHADELKNKDFIIERSLFEKEKELQEAFNNQLQEQINRTESIREKLEEKRDETTELRERLMKLETENSVLQKENEQLKR